MNGQFTAKTIEDHLAVIRVVGPWSCWKLPHRPSNKAGYVRICMDRKMHTAPRAIYETLIGKIPRGLQLDHLCRNRWCCNPNHVEPVTGRVNVLRGGNPTALNAMKTVCLRGHQLGPIRNETRRRRRPCLICKSEWMRRKRRNHAQR